MKTAGFEARSCPMRAVGGAVHAPPQLGCQLGTKQSVSVHFRWGAVQLTDVWLGRGQKQHCPRLGQLLIRWRGGTSQHSKQKRGYGGRGCRYGWGPCKGSRGFSLAKSRR